MLLVSTGDDLIPFMANTIFQWKLNVENGNCFFLGLKHKERVFRKMRDVRMKVCFIYEESSSIYTHKLHRHTIYFT